jgi:hypothetical protein
MWPEAERAWSTWAQDHSLESYKDLKVGTIKEFAARLAWRSSERIQGFCAQIYFATSWMADINTGLWYWTGCEWRRCVAFDWLFTVISSVGFLFQPCSTFRVSHQIITCGIQHQTLKLVCIKWCLFKNGLNEKWLMNMQCRQYCGRNSSCAPMNKNLFRWISMNLEAGPYGHNTSNY